ISKRAPVRHNKMPPLKSLRVNRVDSAQPAQVWMICAGAHTCLAGQSLDLCIEAQPRGDLSRPARHPWALHIAGCVWQSGLAGKPPKTILVTQPTSEAGRTPEGGEHARRLSYGM